MDKDIIGALPYLFVVMAFVLVKLVRLFTQHQQKMTQILSQTSTDRSEIAALRQEISELKALVSESVIATDDRRHTAQATVPPPSPTIADRLHASS